MAHAAITWCSKCQIWDYSLGWEAVCVVSITRFVDNTPPRQEVFVYSLFLQSFPNYVFKYDNWWSHCDYNGEAMALFQSPSDRRLVGSQKQCWDCAKEKNSCLFWAPSWSHHCRDLPQIMTPSGCQRKTHNRINKKSLFKKINLLLYVQWYNFCCRIILFPCCQICS